MRGRHRAAAEARPRARPPRGRRAVHQPLDGEDRLGHAQPVADAARAAASSQARSRRERELGEQRAPHARAGAATRARARAARAARRAGARARARARARRASESGASARTRPSDTTMRGRSAPSVSETGASVREQPTSGATARRAPGARRAIARRARASRTPPESRREAERRRPRARPARAAAPLRAAAGWCRQRCGVLAVRGQWSRAEQRRQQAERERERRREAGATAASQSQRARAAPDAPGAARPAAAARAPRSRATARPRSRAPRTSPARAKPSQRVTSPLPAARGAVRAAATRAPRARSSPARSARSTKAAASTLGPRAGRRVEQGGELVAQEVVPRDAGRVLEGAPDASRAPRAASGRGARAPNGRCSARCRAARPTAAVHRLHVAGAARPELVEHGAFERAEARAAAGVPGGGSRCGSRLSRPAPPGSGAARRPADPILHASHRAPPRAAVAAFVLRSQYDRVAHADPRRQHRVHGGARGAARRLPRRLAPGPVGAAHLHPRHDGLPPRREDRRHGPLRVGRRDGQR